MKAIQQERRLYYRVLVITLGVIILALSVLSSEFQEIHFWTALGAAGFIAFLINFPISIFLSELTLTSVIALGSGFVFGASNSVWVIAAGVLAGFSIRRILKPGSTQIWTRRREWWFDMGFEMGINVIALATALTIFGEFDAAMMAIPSDQLWAVGTSIGFVFVITHGLLFWLDGYFLWGYALMKDRGDLVLLAIIELLPIPLVLIAIESYPMIGPKISVALGGIPAIMAVLLYGVTSTRESLQKRVRELSTLNRVSQALRASPNLDDLLPVIQEQVMEILGVNSFYVALLDAQTNELWYPLAVKHGVQQTWPRRPVADRLTDRVIRDGRPLKLTPQTQRGPNPVGLPFSEAMPKSWLGVPLVTPESTIGCLAVFEIVGGVEFSHYDIDLMNTLSGQVSIAIDNALLYVQVQDRAAQLETLNSLTGKITASLDMQEVAAQLCQAIALVGGGQRSAMYLYDPGLDTVRLAYAHDLSAAFSSSNRQFSIGGDRRARCLRTGEHLLTPDVNTASLPLSIAHSLRTEGIQAYADFPLLTPGGQIGFLSVFFDKPHEFTHDEVVLLQTFAAQAALAVANARLYATTDEKLTRRVQQLAILEAVGRELSAATLSDRLFYLLLDYALEFTHAPWGAIGVCNLDRGIVEIKAKRGYGDRNILLMGTGISGRVMQNRRTENIGDISGDPDFVLIQDGEVISQLSVPILHEQNVLGVITLESDRPNDFSQNEQALVEQLANQAAIALMNANLHRETQHRLSEQSTLYQVATRLSRTLDAQEALDILAQAMIALVGLVDLGIYLWSDDAATFRLQSLAHVETALPLPKELAESVVAGLSFGNANVLDIANEELSDISDLLLDEEKRCVLISMKTAQRLLGLVVLCLDESMGYSKDLYQLLEAIVAQGAIAVQTALLFSETKQRREQLAAVVNSVAESIVMVNAEGQITLANQPIYVLTGMTREEIIGKRLMNLAEGILARLGYKKAELERLLADLMSGNTPMTPKEIYQIPDVLPLRVFERTTYPVTALNDQARGWMVVWRDVTEEHQVNQEREAIAEALIHDLRSPVSAVLGSLDLLEDALPEATKDETIERSLRVARRGAKRVLRLIMSLLDVARMQSGRVELERSPVHLTTLVDELVFDIEMIASEYGIAIQNEMPADLPIVFADQDKLSRVLNNLLDNAVKFSPENGRVLVRGAVEGEHVIIEVWDQGPGVADEYRTAIFERFSQISGQFGRWRGAGLGLAFCKLTIDAHGGDIWVERPPSAQGSIFALRLPIR